MSLDWQLLVDWSGHGIENFCLAGTATASSNAGAGYSPSIATNGDRKGQSFTVGGLGWWEASAGNPQWLEVAFDTDKWVSEIDVFTIQDDFNAPIEPTLTTTFATYGITDFLVQYWNGSWVTIQSVTGNDKVWRQFSFSPVLTAKIRVYVTASIFAHATIVELEAYGYGFGEDVTTRFLAPVTCERGKDQVRRFAPPMAGRLNAILDNRSKDYSAEYTGSPLAGLIRPGRAIRLKIGPDYLWSGVSDDLVQRPQFGNPTVLLSGLGRLSTLSRTISTTLYETIRTDEAIAIILSAINWPAGSVLSRGDTTLEWWWLDETDARTALLELLTVEGAGAALYEDGQGRLVFENRNYRTQHTRSVSSQASFDTTDNVAVFEYHPDYQDIVNQCSLDIIHREAQALQEIWNAGGDVVIPPNEIRIFTIHPSDPFTDAQLPSSAPGSAIQTLTASATLISGTFKLRFRDQTTGSLNYNDSAATIQTALQGLSSIGSGNVLCVGGPMNTAAIIVIFLGTLGGIQIDELIECVESSLNPVSVGGAIEPSEIQAGGGFFIERQALTPSGVLTAGTFTITVDAGTTASINYNDTAATIQTRLQAIPGHASTTATGGPINTTQVQVNFVGFTTDLDLMTITGTNLATSVGSAMINIAQSDKGGQPDYLLMAGEALLSKTLSRTSGQSTDLSLRADDGGATLHGLRLRARPVTQIRSERVVNNNDTVDSVDEFGLRAFVPSPARREMDRDMALSVANSFTSFYLSPRPSASITLLNVGSNLAQQTGREISDKIHIVDAQTGLDKHFHIEQISHAGTESELLTTFGAEMADDVILKYRVLISQSGTSAPTATVLENSLGGTVVWTRTTAGKYVGTLTGAFPDGLTFVLANTVRDGNSADIAAAYRVDANSIAVNTGAQGGSFADSVLSGHPVDLEILVYPNPIIGSQAHAESGLLYRALLTQSGTSAPTATVLTNNFPGGVTWSYNDVGQYVGEPDPDIGFTAQRALLFIRDTVEANSLNQVAAAIQNSALYLNTGTVDLATDSGTFANGILNKTEVQVWSYPEGQGEASTTKIYRAIIKQTGTAAPTVDALLYNNLGITPTFARTSAGQYTITATGAFPSGKTLIKVTNLLTIEDGSRVACYRSSDNALVLNSGTPNAGFLDGLFAGDGIRLEILVYP